MVVVWLAYGTARACQCNIAPIPPAPPGQTPIELEQERVRTASDVAEARLVEVKRECLSTFPVATMSVWFDVGGTSVLTDDTFVHESCTCVVSLPTPPVTEGATGWLVSTADGHLGWFPHEGPGW